MMVMVVIILTSTCPVLTTCQSNVITDINPSGVNIVTVPISQMRTLRHSNLFEIAHEINVS